MSALEFQILKNILEIIIPKNNTNSMPSAADVNVIEFIKRNDKKLMPKQISFVRDINLICQNHLHIPQERWNPGSIQVFRTKEGKVRFRHRNSEIIFAAHFRAPEWGQSLLEEWLMGQRGEVLRPKDKTQRIASIRRNKESIRRNLHSASLDSAKIEMQIVSHRLESAVKGVNPHVLTNDESE